MVVILQLLPEYVEIAGKQREGVLNDERLYIKELLQVI